MPYNRLQSGSPRRPPAARPRRRRFTLLELLVASAILVLLTAILYAAGNAVVQSWSKLRKEQQRFETTMTLERVLDSILSNTVPFLWPDKDGERRPMFEGRPDRVRLAYRHTPGNLEEGALRFVSIFVRNHRLLAVYTERPDLDWDAAPNARTSVLCDKVKAIRLLYADWDSDHGLFWVDAWDPDHERKDIPLAIFITVYWQDGRQEMWMRRTAGSGWFERWGNPPPKKKGPALPR